ncbi:MAG: hypothetical protein ILO36_04095 [Abditibacteriota bacterium]|nr:hypothetical protein [Abditibacteriota bacterium]
MTEAAEKEKYGKGVGFERIRRITGYLVGSLEKFNDAKRKEESERVKHIDLNKDSDENIGNYR